MLHTLTTLLFNTLRLTAQFVIEGHNNGYSLRISSLHKNKLYIYVKK